MPKQRHSFVVTVTCDGEVKQRQVATYIRERLNSDYIVRNEDGVEITKVTVLPVGEK